MRGFFIPIIKVHTLSVAWSMLIQQHPDAFLLPSGETPCQRNETTVEKK